MEITVSLDKKIKYLEDETLYQELQDKVNFDAMRKRNKLPSLTELLYKKTEDEMLSMKELLGVDTE